MVRSSINNKLFREASFALGLSIFGGLITGILWSYLANNFLIMIAGTLALVPVIGQMRGNISGIFTSRLGTGLHLGSIKPSVKNRSPHFNNTLIMNILVSLFAPIWVSILVYIFHTLSGGNTTFFIFLTIAVIAGIVSAIFQIIFALIVAFSIYKSGRDPDVLAYPILSITGDIITIIGIICGVLIYQQLFNNLNLFATLLVELTAIFLLFTFLILVFSKPIRSRLDYDISNLLSETIPVIFLAAIIGSLVGILTDNLAFSGLLLIIPSFMAYTGSLGAIIGSKYTTAYYLGLLESKLGKISMYFHTPLILFGIGLILSTVLGIVGYNIVLILELTLPRPDLYSFLILCWITGFIATIFSISNALIVGNISFQRGIDADNIIVPLTSTFGDLVAVITIVLILSVLTGI